MQRRSTRALPPSSLKLHILTSSQSCWAFATISKVDGRDDSSYTRSHRNPTTWLPRTLKNIIGHVYSGFPEAVTLEVKIESGEYQSFQSSARRRLFWAMCWERPQYAICGAGMIWKVTRIEPDGVVFSERSSCLADHYACLGLCIHHVMASRMESYPCIVRVVWVFWGFRCSCPSPCAVECSY